MATAFIRSLLKETIQELPEDFTMKSQSVPPMLARKGVKPEELEYADLRLPKGKVTKEDLVTAEKQRADWFEVTDFTTDYKDYSLPQVSNNPTYKEKILSFREKGALERGEVGTDMEGTARAMEDTGSRYTSSHFPTEENYLAHTRVFDDTINGTETRVLQEIQSDLHQQGRQVGYDNNEAISKLADAHAVMNWPEFVNRAKELGAPTEILNDLGALERWMHTLEAAPKSPYEKTWLKKSIERELVDAVNEGRKQLAIPISGNVEDLQRSAGVQKWYETTVIDTAKKIAKQTNSTFELVNTGGPEVNFSADKFKELVDSTVDLQGRDRLEAIANFINRNLPRDVYASPYVAGATSRAIKENNFALFTKELRGDLGIEGVTYAVIKPKGNFSVSLYSSPAAAGFAAYMMVREGYSEAEIAKQLQDKGFDGADFEEIYSLTSAAQQMEQSGYSPEEIKEFFNSKEVVTSLDADKPLSPVPGVPDESKFPWSQNSQFLPSTAKLKAYKDLVDPEVKTAQEFVAKAKVLFPTETSTMLTAAPAWFGNKAALRQYDYAREQSRQKILDLAASKGIDLAWAPTQSGPDFLGTGDQWMVPGPDGEYVPLNESFWEDLKAQSGELTLGIAGAVLGGRLAGSKGAFGGGIGGAIAGSELDYLRAATELQVGMEARAMYYKGVNAAEAETIGLLVGYPIAKSLSWGWSKLKDAVDHIVKGDKASGYKALKENFYFDDDQVEEMIGQLDRVMPSNLAKEEKGILATALLEPGAQDLVRLGASIDPRVTTVVTKMIDARAKDVLKTTESLTGEHVPKQFIQDLQNYTADVKRFYNDVKMQAVQNPRSQLFSFDYDKLAIDPIIEGIGKELGVTKDLVTDPTITRYLVQTQKIKALSETRTFGDLIELRQLVNDFLYNKNVAKTKNGGKLRAALNEIDAAIEEGAQFSVERPNEWLNNWYEARSAYTRMKGVEKTALYRSIFDAKGNIKPVQPETVVKGMAKYITALDGNWEEVMSKIPVAGRAKYEGAVVDHFANRYTAGTAEGVQAINFPLLAKEINAINFTTPDARAAKVAINELAEAFKNDVTLSKLLTNLEVPTVNQGLTSDLVAKAKFELASTTWGKIKQALPGQAGRNYDLAKVVARLLEKPLDVKLTKELMAEADEKMVRQIRELQAQTVAKNAKDPTAGKVKLYGPDLKFTGTGDFETIPVHRIAKPEDIKTIAEAEAVTVDSPLMNKLLKEYGFVAVLQGTDRVKKL